MAYQQPLTKNLTTRIFLERMSISHLGEKKDTIGYIQQLVSNSITKIGISVERILISIMKPAKPMKTMMAILDKYPLATRSRMASMSPWVTSNQKKKMKEKTALERRFLTT